MKSKKLIIAISLASLSISNAAFSETKKQTNVMHYALNQNDAAYVKDLMDKNDFDYSQWNSNGQSPIHIAAQNNKVIPFMAVAKNIKNINGFNINNQTPIVVAAKNNSLEMAYALMLSGSDPYLKDEYKLNAFDYAKKLDSPLMYEIISNFSFENSVKDLRDRIKNLEEKLKEKNNQNKENIETEIKFYKDVIEKQSKEINQLVEEKENLKEIIEKQNQKIIALNSENESKYGNRIDKEEILGNNTNNLTQEEILKNQKEEIKRLENSVKNNNKEVIDINSLSQNKEKIKNIPISVEYLANTSIDPIEAEILMSLGLERKEEEFYISEVDLNAFNNQSKKYGEIDSEFMSLILNKSFVEITKPIIILTNKE